MRTAIALTLMLAAVALLAPAASAHGPLEPTPSPGPRVPCPLLPLWDAAVCIANPTIDAAQDWTQWSIDQTALLVHYTGCHVVGGPGCVILVFDDEHE